MKITQKWVAVEAAKRGLVDWNAVGVFNRQRPEALALLGKATNVRRLGPDGECVRRGDLCLFGGTGQCGNKWNAPSGGWYPVAAVVKLGKRGKPRLLAVALDWY